MRRSAHKSIRLTTGSVEAGRPMEVQKTRQPRAQVSNHRQAGLIRGPKAGSGARLGLRTKKNWIPDRGSVCKPPLEPQNNSQKPAELAARRMRVVAEGGFSVRGTADMLAAQQPINVQTTRQSHAHVPNHRQQAGQASKSKTESDRDTEWGIDTNISATYEFPPAPRNFLSERWGRTVSSPRQLRKMALEGFAGTARALPHMDKISRLFAPHRLDNVQAFTGSEAQLASARMGAAAYTCGNRIAFNKSNPSLRTIAHEAAHIVQQGAGIRLPDQVGRTNDPYERNADAVAHAVVTGQSAAGLLARFRPAGSAAWTSPRVSCSVANDFVLQRKACNFYVFDNTDPVIAPYWAVGAKVYADWSYGGYPVASGNTIEEMFSNMLTAYDLNQCDCIEEIQFWSHGHSGYSMSVVDSWGERIDVDTFNIPNIIKYGDGPLSCDRAAKNSAYREWLDWYYGLTQEQRNVVDVRKRICASGATIYYRSCYAFQGEDGRDFAEASAEFWRSKVIGHTMEIRWPDQPGQKILIPGQKPYWPASEGQHHQKKGTGK